MTWRVIASRGTEEVLSKDEQPDACFLRLGEKLAGPFPRAVVFGTGYFTTVEHPVQAVNVPSKTVTAQQYLTAVEQAVVADGASDGSEADAEAIPSEAAGVFTKIDKAQQIVYGYASIIDSGDGVPIEDAQGDIILENDLVEAAHGFMRNHRNLGHRHQKVEGVGDIVESLVITKEVRKALGMPETSPLGWFIGCKVSDPEVWSRVESGELRSFSIGGSGEREQIVAKAKGWSDKARAAALAARKRKLQMIADRKTREYQQNLPKAKKATAAAAQSVESARAAALAARRSAVEAVGVMNSAIAPDRKGVHGPKISDKHFTVLERAENKAVRAVSAADRQFSSAGKKLVAASNREKSLWARTYPHVRRAEEASAAVQGVAFERSMARGKPPKSAPPQKPEYETRTTMLPRVRAKQALLGAKEMIVRVFAGGLKAGEHKLHARAVKDYKNAQRLARQKKYDRAYDAAFRAVKLGQLARKVGGRGLVGKEDGVELEKAWSAKARAAALLARKRKHRKIRAASTWYQATRRHESRLDVQDRRMGVVSGIIGRIKGKSPHLDKAITARNRARNAFMNDDPLSMSKHLSAAEKHIDRHYTARR